MEPLLSSTAFFSSLLGDDHKLQSGIPQWIRDYRRGDLDFLATARLPSFKDEEWLYTPLSPLWRQPLKLVDRLDGVLPDQFKKYFIEDAVNILIYNGRIAGDITLPDQSFTGVSIEKGDAAFKRLEASREYFSTLTPNDSPLFGRLNRVLFSDPLVISVGRAVTSPGLINIVNIITSPDAAVFPRIMIKVNEGASLNVVQSYLSIPDIAYLDLPVTDIVLDAGARLDYGERHLHSTAGTHIGAVRVWQKKDSTLRSCILSTGAGIFRSNVNVILEGQGASAEINGLHSLQGEAHADSHTYLEHVAPNTTSNQLYKCVLEGESHSVFHGRVFVHREAQQTNSYQLNKNLLLSRECRVDTKPQLEIKADDVKCTHGATIGQMDEDQLFYLQTRAVSRDEAVRMLVRGFMDDVLSRVQNPLVREALTQE
ncbi:MAG: Fe-S cluster assembly protein SufD [Candidatus Omnitrophica bacterium]|nr:Fe-S cluster assembly protein SufD [Candidatus Omnitrophota bacterium]